MFSGNPSTTTVDGDEWPDLYEDGQRLDDYFQSRLLASKSLRIQLALKRVIDILMSAALLFLLAPVFLACFIAIKLSSPGPVLFSQQRWGLNQTRFRCLKLRSMYVPACISGQNQERIADSETGKLVKMRKDPRVTPVGRLLRRTSIDELPQLINVFRGEMSMVGPRPLVLPMLVPFPEFRAVRSVMPPGVTGLWQIRNRQNNTSALHMLHDDVEYIRRFTLWLDLKILFATPREVLTGTGAH